MFSTASVFFCADRAMEPPKEISTQLCYLFFP
jgi:hypothetical protein